MAWRTIWALALAVALGQFASAATLRGTTAPPVDAGTAGADRAGRGAAEPAHRAGLMPAVPALTRARALSPATAPTGPRRLLDPGLLWASQAYSVSEAFHWGMELDMALKSQSYFPACVCEYFYGNFRARASR